MRVFDSEGKILRPNFGDPRVVTDGSYPRQCAHKYIVLYVSERKIICRQCKELVDSYRVLSDLAMDWAVATHREQEIADLEAKVEELKREAAAVRAQIRKGYKDGSESKIQLYYEQLLEKVNAATTWSEEHDIQMWVMQFKWLSPEQNAQVKEAVERMKLRIKHSKGRRRRRALQVLEGGKDE